MSYLVDLIRNDLGAAQDNLYRAKLATRGVDPTKQWGDSGKTLQSIMDGYQRWVDKATTALAEAERKGTVTMDHITALSPTCTTVRRGDELTVALNRDGNDAGRVTPQDAWKLLAVLEAFIRDTGGPS